MPNLFRSHRALVVVWTALCPVVRRDRLTALRADHASPASHASQSPGTALSMREHFPQYIFFGSGATDRVRLVRCPHSNTYQSKIGEIEPSEVRDFTGTKIRFMRPPEVEASTAVVVWRAGGGTHLCLYGSPFIFPGTFFPHSLQVARLFIFMCFFVCMVVPAQFLRAVVGNPLGKLQHVG